MVLAQNNCNCNVIDKFEGVIAIAIELKWCNWSNSGLRVSNKSSCWRSRSRLHYCYVDIYCSFACFSSY